MYIKEVISMSNSVISVVEYGKIEIRLKDLMDERNITRNHLAKTTNTRFEVINKWYNNNVEKMDLDVLARICYALGCTPADIIKYKPD